MYRYFAIYKPFGMLSQFTVEGGNTSLASIDFKFPQDVYPVGRLDSDSEGLLLLTNDKKVNHRLLEPTYKHKRKYLVQVEGEISAEATKVLEAGMELNDKGKTYRTLPAKAKVIPEPALPERTPPVRFRKNVPTSWVEISISEGKNRQVRKMTAAAGFPTLRLIRIEIEDLRLSKQENGWVEELKKLDFYSRLKINQ